MAEFFRDGFAGTAGTNLTARTSDSGHSWAKRSGFVGDLVLTAAARVRNGNNAGTGCCYEASA
ncbi:MAG TPA: hypothetical protein VFU47_12725, partial [Armatimonadota bacterium]|nr:hypothetical protein [Armatimonadota bacterium]